MPAIPVNVIAIWVQFDEGEEFDPYVALEGRAGLTGKTVPVFSTTTNQEVDVDGVPKVMNQIFSAPADGPSNTLNIYDRAFVTFLEKKAVTGGLLSVQERITECAPELDDPNAWDKVRWWAAGRVETFNPGDAPVLGGSTDNAQLAGSMQYRTFLVIARTAMNALVTTEVDDILSVDGLGFNLEGICKGSYPGPDKILFFGSASDGLADSDLLYTNNGGGNIAAATNAPYAGLNNEGLDHVAVKRLTETTGRVIVGTKSVVAGSPARIAWGDFEFGDEANVGAFTVVPITNSSNGDVVEALFWQRLGRLYLAAAGNIYVTTKRGTAVDEAAVYTATSTPINGFAESPDGRDVYAYGDSNLILRERDKSGTFVARTGPSGGGNFTALAVAWDNTIYAGNGQRLYKSTNQADNTGGWEIVEDFGANMEVSEIQIIDDYSQALRVVVTDTTPGTASVYESIDGGANLRANDGAVNNGYAAAYFSKIDHNLGIVVGAANGGAGVIHQLAEAA